MDSRERVGRVRRYRVRIGAAYKILLWVPVLAAGIQLGWALQLSLLTPYVQELGIPHAWASWIWLCGPITGLFAQPIVGHYSDQCTSSWGKRRPFILAGTCTVTVAVLLIGYSADLGWMLGDNLVEGRLRPYAIGIFIIGFWFLDLANNIMQGPLRALLADMAGNDPRRVRTANGFFTLWFSIGNIAGFAAGSYSGWHRLLPFTVTQGCGVPCANLKSAFLLAVAVLWLTTVVTLFSSIDPWHPRIEFHTTIAPPLTVPLLEEDKEPEAAFHRIQSPASPPPNSPHSPREHHHHHAENHHHASSSSVHDVPGEVHHEKRKSGQVPGLTTTLSTPDLILWEVEKMEEEAREAEAEGGGEIEGGDGGAGPREEKVEIKGIVAATVGNEGYERAVTVGDHLPVSTVGESVSPLGMIRAVAGRGLDDEGIKKRGSERWEDEVAGGEDEEINEAEGEEEEEVTRVWFLAEVISHMKHLPTSVWFVMLVLVFTWLAQFPFLLFDTDWMGRDIFRGSPAAAEGAVTAELYYNGVHAGSFGLLLNSIISIVTSLALEPICRKIGTKWVWIAGNIVLSTCLGLTAVVTRIASHHKVIVHGLARGPPSYVRYCALAIFAAIGIPIAVTNTVPYSLAATYTQGTGGGQGLTMGVVNLAIVVPQIIVSVVSGPWDELFGGGNVPAFVAGSTLAFVGAVVALFVLMNPPPEQNDRHARLRRTLSCPI